MREAKVNFKNPSKNVCNNDSGCACLGHLTRCDTIRNSVFVNSHMVTMRGNQLPVYAARWYIGLRYVLQLLFSEK